MLIQLQKAYASLADHFDQFENNTENPHVQETLDIIARVITDRATSAVPLAAGNVARDGASHPTTMANQRSVHLLPSTQTTRDSSGRAETDDAAKSKKVLR